MSTPFDDAELAVRLRAALKKKGVSMRTISEHLEIPYRTVQNYISGSQKIPAIFLLKVCHLTGIEPSFFIYEDFKLNYWDMYDAVFEVMNRLSFLPEPQTLRDPELGITFEDHTGRKALASRITADLISRYDHWSSERLRSKVHLPGQNVPFGKRSPRIGGASHGSPSASLPHGKDDKR